MENNLEWNELQVKIRDQRIYDIVENQPADKQPKLIEKTNKVV